MFQSIRYNKWLFTVFPALAVMLGWGLRGHIGGGPFGAMIPGAMMALSLGLLLKMPVAATSVLVVFGVFGIGLGGEMTYGQTLGFLRNPETVLWGTTGTTVKGAVWGLLGGTVLATGFFFRQIPKKTYIIAFLLMMAGMWAGFRLINDPMLIYFSDPENPRAESWAALLFGAIVLLGYLKTKLGKKQFSIVFWFALFGMIGGGLGFGLGGLWMVLGSYLPDFVFKSWWKAMEFTFGLLLGASLGYAAWINRYELGRLNEEERKSGDSEPLLFWKELLIALFAGLVTFWLIPETLEPIVDSNHNSTNLLVLLIHDIARLAVNYAFYGFLFVLVVLRFPQMAWQIGITLTICHTLIDLFRDFFPETNTLSPFSAYFISVFLTTTLAAILVAFFSRQKNVIRNLFLLLIWSCIAVSFSRMGIKPETLNFENLSFCQLLCGRFFVDIFFTMSALVVSYIIVRKFQSIQ